MKVFHIIEKSDASVRFEYIVVADSESTARQMVSIEASHRILSPDTDDRWLNRAKSKCDLIAHDAVGAARILASFEPEG